MARRQVIEVECSRCDRKELRDAHTSVSSASNNVTSTEPPRALIVRLADGTRIDFEDLCDPCMGAVRGHLEAIGKKIVGLSPERKKKDEPAVEQVAKKKGPA